jgi:hypothetical protein
VLCQLSYSHRVLAIIQLGRRTVSGRSGEAVPRDWPPLYCTLDPSRLETAQDDGGYRPTK